MFQRAIHLVPSGGVFYPYEQVSCNAGERTKDCGRVISSRALSSLNPHPSRIANTPEIGRTKEMSPATIGFHAQVRMTTDINDSSIAIRYIGVDTRRPRLPNGKSATLDLPGSSNARIARRGKVDYLAPHNLTSGNSGSSEWFQTTAHQARGAY